MTEAKKLIALIVDDEPAARRLLTDLLESEPDIDVAGTCRHGSEAVAWLQSHRADLLFLDIQMPGLDGFQVLETLETPPPAVVFVTAHDEHALRAFEFEAYDYLLKPFDEERLRQTLGRVRRRFDSAHEGSNPELASLLARVAEPPRSLERVAIPHGRGRITLKLKDVLWLQAESNYVRFHLATNSYLTRMSLSALEERLDSHRFARIHRSIIVNAEFITRLEPRGHGDLELTMEGGRHLTVSRRYRNRLERVLESLP